MSRTATPPDDSFGAYDDDYRGFEPRDGEEARGPLILALAIGVLLIFGAVIWKAYKQGVRGEGEGLPIVFADASPYKRVPPDPGGVSVPDQERRLYDQIDGSVRTVASLPEQGGEGSGGELVGGPPIELRPGEEEDIDEVTGIPKAAGEQFAQFENLDDTPVAQPRETVRATALPPVAEVPVAAATLRPQFAFAAAGGFLVQIDALRSQEAADAAWVKATAAHPALFAGAEKRVQRADLGAKGVFYRLRVGAFADRAGATGFCDALKQRGETCFVAEG